MRKRCPLRRSNPPYDTSILFLLLYVIKNLGTLLIWCFLHSAILVSRAPDTPVTLRRTFPLVLPLFHVMVV